MSQAVDSDVNKPGGAGVSLRKALAQAQRHRNEGRLQEAEALCRRVLEAQPDTAEAEHLLGVIEQQRGKLGEAIEHLRRAVKLAPRVALFHANLGEMLRLAGRPKLAAEAARRAIEIKPDMAVAQSNLGVALYELKDFEGAVGAQRKAIATNPDFAEAYSNLGNALYALRRFDEAIAAYRRAIELRPDFADAWANLGTTLHHAGDFDEAVPALRRAIALAPQHANARSGLGILLLMRGDFGEGWEEYEWRLRSSERKGPRFPEQPWQGETLVGKHVYVQAEQGLGDSLQFARYLPLLAARAGGVTVRVHQQLVPLLRESLPGITVLGERDHPRPFAYDLALLSLPRLFKTRLETIPAGVPYLQAPKKTALRWKKRLTRMAGLKVGIVWAGNPEHVNDARRSLDPSLLAPLFAVVGTAFASLQVGPRAADVGKLANGGRPIDDLARELSDFSETAGAIAALDLVITVDTSVAHLAGALGKPVWVLLPWVTDWRWMLARQDCPWYPTMRLFRQDKAENLPEVIARVTHELEAVAQGDTIPLMPFKAEGERRASQAAAIIALEGARATAPTDGSTPRIHPGRALVLAEQKRRQGFLAEADELARRVIAADPGSAEAVHMLGIMAHQSGKIDEAIEHLRRAIAFKGDVALYHANLGEMYRLAGRLDEAIAAGRRALELDPKTASALNNLGIALFDHGDFEQALHYYESAISLQANFAQAHSNRGNTLQRLKRFADAEKAYRRALELQPDFEQACNNLGTCLRELKRPEEAEAAYRRALKLDTSNAETLDNLALALKDLERWEEAADLLARAIAIEPRNDKLLVHYASILLDQDKLEESATAADRAIALNPNNYDAVNLMGRVAFDRGDLQAATAHYRRALRLKPDLADAHNNLGNVFKSLGQLAEAEAAYVEALRIDPSTPGVYINLGERRTFKPNDPHLAAMEKLAASSAGMSKNERLQLDFGLGKAYADLRDYGRSFAHFASGNAAKRRTFSYDERAALAVFDRIEATFTPELFAAKQGSGDPSSMPIFIIGMPRSGTTLIEQIIASHPLVHGAGELKNLDDVVRTVRGRDDKTIPYPEFVPPANAVVFKKIGARYVASVSQFLTGGHERITDKMPSNYYFAGLIQLVLPNAVIIHAVRDPVDTCVSCFSKLFAAEQKHTYDLGELGRYHKRYQRLMDHWHRVLPAGRILDVGYEDVVADLEGQARRIIAHCGLKWDQRCLSFYETERPIRTASAVQVRQPIYQTAIGRWRVYEPHLLPLLNALDIS